MAGVRGLGQQRHRPPELASPGSAARRPARLAQPRRPLASQPLPAPAASAPPACRAARCRETRAGRQLRISATKSSVSRNSASVSVGKPAIRSAPIAMPGPQRPRPRDRRRRIGAQMPALHALQDQVAARLQRQVQMRHQPRLLADQPPEVVVDRRRIERGQPQPRQLRHQRQQPPHHLAQARRPGRSAP